MPLCISHFVLAEHPPLEGLTTLFPFVFQPLHLTAFSLLKALVEGAIAMFDELTGVLGLVYNRKTETLDSDVEALIEARTNARKEKNWAEADRIRDQLKEMGIVLEDTAQGVKWHRE